MLKGLGLSKINQFFSDVKLELKKVSWPGRKEVYGTTIVVLCTVFFFGIFLLDKIDFPVPKKLIKQEISNDKLITLK